MENINESYGNYAIKNICKMMHTLFSDHACENCILTNINNNKKCTFAFNTIPKDWELDEKGNLTDKEVNTLDKFIIYDKEGDK